MMKEKAARAAEAALRAQPKEVRQQYKTTVTGKDGNRYEVEGYARRDFVPSGITFNELKSAGGGAVERSDVAIITTDCVDRDGEVVMAEGLDFSAFQKNPVVTWAHDYKAYAAGMAQWVAKTKVGDNQGWKAKTVYTPRPPTFPKDHEWWPDSCFWMGKTGFLRGRSIGFIPLSVRPATQTDARQRAEWANARRFIDGASVVEYCCCIVPANQLSLRDPQDVVDEVSKAKAAGFIIGKSMLDALGVVIPESVPTVEQAEAPIVLDSAVKDFAAEATLAGGGAAVAPQTTIKPHQVMPKDKSSQVCAVLPAHVHEAAKTMAKSVGSEHLADGDQPGEHHPHVKYLNTQDPAEVQGVVKGYGACAAYTGKCMSLHNADRGHDEIHVKLDSYDLKGLHKKLATLPHNEKIEGGYEPSIHLANVKAGHGEAVAKELGDSMPMEGMTLSMKSLRMKTHDGGLHDIHLDSEGKSFKSVLSLVFKGNAAVPVICPRCQQPDSVCKSEDGEHDYHCDFCNSDFDEDDKPEPGYVPTNAGDHVEGGKTAAGGIALNPACHTKAMADAKAGKFSEKPWLAPVGADRKSEFCLSEDGGAADGSALRFKHPIFDRAGFLSREAVARAVARKVAGAEEIMQAITAHIADKTKSAQVLTADEINAAVEKNLNSRQPEIAEAVAQRTLDLILGRLGRV